MNAHTNEQQEGQQEEQVNNDQKEQKGSHSPTFQLKQEAPDEPPSDTGGAAGKNPRIRSALQLQTMANNSRQTQQAMQLQAMVDRSPRNLQAIQLQAMADNSARAQEASTFKEGIDKSPRSRAYEAQLRSFFTESTTQKSTVQRKASPVIQKQDSSGTPSASQNSTGLPDRLKSGIEHLSGHSMNDVKVHYNSPKPAQLQALAYTQGTDIHVGPGQQKHLPHEAWHVVQQKQNRVTPTVQMKGVGINDDRGLEREADVMGAKAAQYQGKGSGIKQSGESNHALVQRKAALPIQLKSMGEVMDEQKQRHFIVSDKSYGKEKNAGIFTTVGFEWDIAKLKDDDSSNPNILEGLSHVELAESDFEWNALPYFLETDAGNVLEFVTPPFYVRTRGPGSTLPISSDLLEIINATRQALGEIVQADLPLGKLIVSDWRKFNIGGWVPRDLSKEISSKNWSWRAKDGDTIDTALGSPSDLTGPTGNIEIEKSMVDQSPQINIAVDAETFEYVQAPESRLGSKDENVLLFNNILKKIDRFLFGPFDSAIAEADGGKGNVRRFFGRFAQVLAQQAAVQATLDTAKLQETGFGGDEISTKEMKAASGKSSFIKDIYNVWLKTDLLTFGFGMSSKEWLAIHDIVTSIYGKQFKRFKLKSSRTPSQDEGGEEVEALMAGVFKKLLSVTSVMAKAYETKKGSGLRSVLGTELTKIGDTKVGFNEHNPNILGVRQDTFIKPTTMWELSKRLNFSSMLHVMETRNSDHFMEWLIRDEKGKSSSSSSSSSSMGGTDKMHPPPLKRTFNPILEKPYRENLAHIQDPSVNRNLAHQPNLGIPTFVSYPLSQTQITDLNNRNIRPIQVYPNGDCWINAVIYSMGDMGKLPDESPRELRAIIATMAYNAQAISSGQAEDILQPGHWALSHITMPFLTDYLDVQVIIVDGQGNEHPVGPLHPGNGTVRIYHVAAHAGIGHYYGSRQ